MVVVPKADNKGLSTTEGFGHGFEPPKLIKVVDLLVGVFMLLDNFLVEITPLNDFSILLIDSVHRDNVCVIGPILGNKLGNDSKRFLGIDFELGAKSV